MRGTLDVEAEGGSAATARCRLSVMAGGSALEVLPATGDSRLQAMSEVVRAAYQALSDYLAAGEYRPGERIGTERELSERFAVSRASLRKAISVLEDESRVQRWVGRTGGLYAADSLIHRQLNTILGVPEIVRLQGRSLETTLLGASEVSATNQVARALELDSGAPVFEIVRVRHVDGDSWSLDHSYLSATQFPGMLQGDLTRSLYERINKNYGVQLDHADETVEVHPATSEEARHLGIAQGATLLKFWRTTYGPDDLPVEFACDLFRADRTRVHMQKHGVNWKRSVNRGGAI